ncbi:EH domain-containing protein 1 [Lactuca sativa]|uniref:EH domain-containing protein 1 n=1 Tax=Lactuca sativa TaxID=4236 RepID=UPI000CBF48E1|nr:EH domain-containing protein 1 [Lactuca sativa]
MVNVSGSIASCSKEHQKIYQKWFDYVDSDGDGRITGDDATKFFAMSNIEKPDLKQIWTIADSKRQGFLGFTEFITAMQLIYLAQTGHEINADLMRTDVDLELLQPPLMEGLGLLLENHSGSLTNHPSETNGIMSFEYVSPRKTPLHTPRDKVTSIIDGLKRLYNEKLKPLEIAYHYNDFGSSLLSDTDFDAKPMVMLLGQYSTGKTTFIKHILKCNYPGAHIGPEPTTDKFIVVMGGPHEVTIPGNTIAVHADMPFTALATFGGTFLSKFECAQMPHPLLEHMTFVDTPGVLSGEKQLTQRSYDYAGAIKWFSHRCDIILLLFDPTKLDISDEFKRVIWSLRGQDDKIRVVLNKADQVDTPQLMRVYGALMWSLGKVLKAPEVARVYIGSFNDKPINEELVDPKSKELFEKEQDDILVDLKDIPKKACDRRINEFVNRTRGAKIHAYIISQLRKEMPILGKSKAKQRLMKNLQDVFTKVEKEFHVPTCDFPDVEQFRQVLGAYNFDKFEKLNPKMIEAADDMIRYDIPHLLKNFRNPYE